MGFDWGFSNKQVEMHNQLYNTIGEFAYTGFTVNKINKINKTGDIVQSVEWMLCKH